jgi:outer membrane protein
MGYYVLPSNRSSGRHPALSDGILNNPTMRSAWNDAREAALTAGLAESTFLSARFSRHCSGWQLFHSATSIVGTPNNVTANGNIEVLSIQWLLFDFG